MLENCDKFNLRKNINQSSLFQTHQEKFEFLSVAEFWRHKEVKAILDFSMFLKYASFF